MGNRKPYPEKCLTFHVLNVDYWRRGRDSNPRYGYPYAAFRVRCFQPLSHLSVAAKAQTSLSVGGYVSNASRLNKNGLSPGAGHRGVRWRDMVEDLSDESHSARGCVLAEPADDQVSNLKVVPVHHQHVGVALVAAR